MGPVWAVAYPAINGTLVIIRKKRAQTKKSQKRNLKFNGPLKQQIAQAFGMESMIMGKIGLLTLSKAW